MRDKLIKIMFCSLLVSMVVIISNSATAQVKQKKQKDSLHVAIGSVYVRKLPGSTSGKKVLKSSLFQKQGDIKIDTSRRRFVKGKNLINPSFYNRWISKSKVDSSK